MANYHVIKINFSSVPTGTQTGTLEYKLSTAPASSYILVNASVTVATDGTITNSPPIIITGLTSGLLYDVRFTNHCGSPPPTWTISITAP